MYKGIEEEITFSRHHKRRQKITIKYMEAVSNFQNLEKELPEDRSTWTNTQVDEMEELKEVVEHFRAMPIILEFHILIENFQKSRKKTQSEGSNSGTKHTRNYPQQQKTLC